MLQTTRQKLLSHLLVRFGIDHVPDLDEPETQSNSTIATRNRTDLRLETISLSLARAASPYLCSIIYPHFALARTTPRIHTHLHAKDIHRSHQRRGIAASQCQYDVVILSLPFRAWTVFCLGPGNMSYHPTGYQDD